MLVVLAGAELIPWWSRPIPGGLVVLFFGVSRFSVPGMRRSLDPATPTSARRRRGHGVHEPAKVKAAASPSQPGRRGVHRGAKAPGVLWDPVPITVPTYVSKPLAPRTVRTIDLSGPAPTFVAPIQQPGHR